MASAISSAVHSGHGNAVLLAGLIGLVASDIIPTPGDAVYFWDQQRLKKMLNDKKITAEQYWLKNAAGYYLYNSGWWALVMGTVMLSKGDFNSKLKLLLALAGGGFVVGVILKNIKKDQND
jgi:hypothetical protein